MKRAQLFPVKRPRRLSSEVQLFSPEIAAANKELLGQHLREAGLVEAANIYFQDFYVRNERRHWILPGAETWEDLRDAQVDYVLKHAEWFMSTIKRLRDAGKLEEDNLNYGSAKDDMEYELRRGITKD